VKKLILASQSPRRSEILKRAGFQFHVQPAYVSEIPDKNLSLDEQILKIAKDKGQSVANTFADLGLDALVLSADTMVCIDNRPLGKPNDMQDAMETLKLLSGRSHEVKTAIFFKDVKSGDEVSHIETTYIGFRKLTLDEIEHYVQTGEPMDKAGSYAIQGGAKTFVSEIRGDYDNVVGLPIQKVLQIMDEKKWKV